MIWSSLECAHPGLLITIYRAAHVRVGWRGQCTVSAPTTNITRIAPAVTAGHCAGVVDPAAQANVVAVGAIGQLEMQALKEQRWRWLHCRDQLPFHVGLPEPDGAWCAPQLASRAGIVLKQHIDRRRLNFVVWTRLARDHLVARKSPPKRGWQLDAMSVRRVKT